MDRIGRQMKRLALTGIMLSSIAGCQTIPETAADALCKPLQEFVASIGPNVTQEVVFYTSWGGGFKGDDERTLFAKRCNHQGYEPAKAVCDSLMKSGAVEFSGNNAKRAVSCLSPRTRFAERMQLNRADFEFSYGSDDRGANVKIRFTEDSNLGAMALHVIANGY